jgi:hypothetical protein
VKQVIWLLLVAAAAACGYWLWSARRRWQAHQRAADERLAAFLLEARKSVRAPDKAAPD